jgi:hypothetical protein
MTTSSRRPLTVTYAQERRRLATAIRRLKRAETAGAHLAHLRLLQRTEALLLAVAGVLGHEIAELTGEVLRERGRA